MSARLVCRKPRAYASFVAVSISRVRLSGCAVRIFSDSGGVSYLTNSYHKPDAPVLSTPATRQFGRWWMVDQSKRRGLECELPSQEFYRCAESPNFSPYCLPVLLAKFFRTHRRAADSENFELRVHAALTCEVIQTGDQLPFRQIARSSKNNQDTRISGWQWFLRQLLDGVGLDNGRHNCSL